MPDGSYTYFEYILKLLETITDNLPVQVYTNEIKNRTFFKKGGYKLELFSLETMKLLGRTKNDLHQDKNEEYVPKWESVDVALAHCNLVNNNYQQASKVLFTLVQINNLVN